MTTTDVQQLLARLDQVCMRLDRIEADLSGVLGREREEKLRRTIEAEVRARYGVDEITDASGPYPLPVRTGPSLTVPAPEEKTDPLDGLVNTVRSNYRFSVVALLMLAAIIFGGVPQMIAALQTLGYLPPSPVPVELQVEPATLFEPEPMP